MVGLSSCIAEHQRLPARVLKARNCFNTWHHSLVHGQLIESSMPGTTDLQFAVHSSKGEQFVRQYQRARH